MGQALAEHYTKQDWQVRNEELLSNIKIHEALVENDKIILPPFHIKLGFIEQFVKNVKYLWGKFPK